MLSIYLLKVSLTLAIVTLGYRWLIQFETFSKINRALLFFNVIVAWLLPLVPMPTWGPTSIQNNFHEQIVPRLLTSATEVQQKNVVEKITTITTSNSSGPNWNIFDLIALVYCFGVAFLALQLVLRLAAISYSLWKLPSEKLDSGIILIRDKKALSPYSFFKWIVCNPEQHTREELEHIFAHESEHVLKWHSLDLFLAEIQRIALWANPFAWFHQKMVQENLEYLADRAVLEKGFPKKQYQFSLLATALQDHKIPLTNSFAQSLLKKRIKMMNKKSSNIQATAKYVLLIVLLYVSPAFVAPYTKSIEIPASEIRMSTLKEQAGQTGLPEEEKKPERTDYREKITTNTLKAKRSKWILEKQGTLYWAISPLATLDDINEIRLEIKYFGGEMNINKIEYDPFQNFITALVVEIKGKGGSGRGSAVTGNYLPIRGYYGYLTKSGEFGMGQVPPENINVEVEKDYQKAVAIKKANSSRYLEEDIKSSFKGRNVSFSGWEYSSGRLKDEKSEAELKQIGIEKAFDNTLTILPVNQFAEFYLNGNQTTLSNLNTISFDDLEEIKYTINSLGQRYFFIKTK